MPGIKRIKSIKTPGNIDRSDRSDTPLQGSSGLYSDRINTVSL
jgi:hypothetical protein